MAATYSNPVFIDRDSIVMKITDENTVYAAPPIAHLTLVLNTSTAVLLSMMAVCDEC